MKNLKKHFCRSEVAIFLCGFVFILQMSPQLTEIFQYDRQAIFDGQIWRLFTGHFCHWNNEHFFWDFFAFAILVVVSCQWSVKRLNFLLLVSPVIISLTLLFVEPQMMIYRGLSGLDCALAMNVLLLMLNEDSSLLYNLAVSVLCLWTGKICYETFVGTSIFVESGEFRVILASHYIGGICAFIPQFIAKTKAHNYFTNLQMEMSHD